MVTLLLVVVLVVVVVVVARHGVKAVGLSRRVSIRLSLPVLSLVLPHLLAVEENLLDGQDDEEATAHQELGYGILGVIFQLPQHLK